jgi:hypothetical protein
MSFDSTRKVYRHKKKLVGVRQLTGEANVVLPLATLFGYKFIIRKKERLISTSSKCYRLSRESDRC